MPLIVTRPAGQARPWLQALHAAGVDAAALPLIEIVPSPQPEAVRDAWRDLPSMAFAMFVSANAVQHFFALRPPGAAWPASLQAGSTGPGTSGALRAAGLSASQVVTPDEAAGRFDSEALWALIGSRPWQGTQVLVVRGEDGRPWLAGRWQQAGATVRFVAAYARRVPQPDAGGRALLERACARPQEHVWHFSSGEAVQHLGTLVPGADWHAATALVTHERIADQARAAGFGRVRVVEAGVEAAAAALQALAVETRSVQSGRS